MDQTQKEELPAVQNSTLNVLLLGPTGVGKSTFINALANYLTYPSLHEAIESKDGLVSLIHSEFSMTDTKDGRRVKTTISVGPSDDDEVAKGIGESCTQKCKAYKFRVGEPGAGRWLRLIDTPGIGDTRGFDQDIKNMKEILSSISKYEVLNAVCILLKPNEARLTDSLRYCIVQLLQKLHKNASRNILFCFTNSRSTFYQVEDTYGLLETMLKRNSRDDSILLDINLADEKTMYCFDSEAFRFCAAKKKGIHFEDSEVNSFAESWKKSTDQALLLIKHIHSLPPHSTNQTVSLNRVRHLLETLQEPLGKITAAMQTNLDRYKDIQKQINDSHDKIIDKSKLLFATENVMETVNLPHPRTVCTEPKCRAENKVCHDQCDPAETVVGIVEKMEDKFRGFGTAIQKAAESVPGMNMILAPLASSLVPTNAGPRVVRTVLGKDDKFVFCEKLSWRSGSCTVCNCSNDNHIRETSELKEVTITTKVPEIQKILDDTQDEAERKKKLLEVHKQKETSIKTEIDIVLKAAALFAGFLEQNSIITYHSATAAYFRGQISQKKKNGDDSTDEGAARIRELEKFLEEYQKHVLVFKKFNQGTDAVTELTEDDVMKEVQKLFQLESNGKAFEKWFSGVQSEYDFKRAVDMGREEFVYKAPVVQAAASSASGEGAPATSLHSRLAVWTARGRKQNATPASS